MNILIIGAGGREEAIARHFQNYSPGSYEVFMAPGNGAGAFRGQNLSLPLESPFDELLSAVREYDIDLTVIGPEDYLSAGIADALNHNGAAVFGPSSDASRLESSKRFAKEVMAAAGVDTAPYREFTHAEEAEDFLRKEFQGGRRWVLKADGLCAGKGVVVPATQAEALSALGEYFHDRKFGSAGDRIIIEEFMEGEEASVLAFSDGKSVRSLPAAQDHKRIFDGDRGPNTGGMGVYTPVEIFRPGFQERVEREILLPVIKEMARRGIPYRGILYAGLMIQGEKIRVVEFNVRFGDPECQCLLPLLESDLGEVMRACAEGRLDRVPFQTRDIPAVCVVLASGGYPGKYQTGKEIQGLENISAATGGVGFEVYHAGTEYRGGKFFSSGGRVLSVCGYARDPDISLEQVITACYQEVEKIGFEGCYYRRDIGARGIRGERS